MASLEHYQALLPDYQIQKELGEGGFSQTLLARRGPEQKPCVLKVLSLKRSHDWKAVELFEREARVLRHLNHPGIPDFYDSFNLSQDHESFFFLVQEYLPGQSLQQWIEAGRRYTENQVIDMACKLAEILVYLQAFSPPVIHRDIKPSNIMLDQQGQVWLIDFGAVKDSLQQVQGRGSTIVGTFGYMPLEQYEGRAQPASDIYGLGMSLLYALSGTEPMQMKKKGLKTDFRQHLQLSEGLARILERMIEPDIALRYPDARQVYSDLQKLSSKPAAGSTAPQHNQGAAMLGIALLIIAGGLGTVWLQHKPAPNAATPIGNAVLNLLTENSGFPAPWQPASVSLPERVQAMYSAGDTLWFSDSSHVYALRQNQLRQWDAENLLTGSTYYGFQLTGDGQGGVYALGRTSANIFGLSHISLSQQTRIPLPGPGPFDALALHGQDLLLANGPKLWRYKPETQQWQILASVPARYSRLPDIRALLVHKDQIWLAADARLWQLSNTALQPRTEVKGFIQHLAAGPDGRIWLSSREELSVFDPGSASLKKMHDKEEVQSLLVDQDNGIWVGTRESGLLHWLPDSQRWQALGWREGLPDDQAKALSLQGDRLWLALDSAPPHWASLGDLKAQLRKDLKLPVLPAQRYNDACSAVAHQPSGGQVQVKTFQGKTHVFFNGKRVCPQGNAAINTQGTAVFHDYTHGIVRSGSDGNQLLGRPPGIQKYVSVQELMIDPADRIWLSFYNEGVFMHNGSWQRINTPEDFRPIFGAQGDQVWLGRNSSKGPQLLLYQNQTLKSLTINDRFLTVQQILGLPDGGAAVASTQGLFVLDAQHKARHISSDQGLPGNYIWRMTQTPEGFWLSVDKGITWLSWPGGKSRQISSREGLFSDRIRYLAVDDQQNLWLQNQHGEVAIYQQDDLR